MVITDLEQEKIASSDKKANRKANTLGSDRSVVEEPFGNANIILPDDIFVKTPNPNSGFAAPDYGDLGSGDGKVATRHLLARLHPVEASGHTGPNSIQSFVVVSKTPESDDPVDIEAVRIKHLVPPDLSLGRSHAAETDGYLRGFEMALYPAQSTGGAGTDLDAYTDMGAIPITADPSAVEGIGNDGRWVVDYANGIVRLSTPALNGPTGLFNPKNVFGDKNGKETAVAAEGRLTLFATFYVYTGPSFQTGGGTVSVNMLTVGDGADSYGSFYGPTAQVMKNAINSLNGLGGTIFVNSGTYNYEQPIEIPDNVNIVGLSANVTINGQGGKPIFVFQGSHSSIHNLTLFASGSAGAIEFGGTGTLENAIIKNNVIWSDASSKGVVFAPRNTGVVYQNCGILNNHFKTAASSTTYIGQTAYASNTSSIDGVRVDGNDFVNTASASSAIDLSNGTVTTAISDLSIIHNHFGAMTSVNINNGAVAADVFASNNAQANGFSAYGLLDSEVSQNEYASFTIGLGGLSETRIAGSTLGDVTLDGYIADTTMDSVITDTFVLDDSCSNLNISNMTCRANASFNGSAVDGNNVSMDNVVVSGSRFLGEVRIAHALSVATSTVSEFVLDNNVIDGALKIANAPATAVVSLTFENMRITNNTIADINRDSISVGATGTAENIVFNSLLMSGNTCSGDVRFLEDVDFNTDQNSIFAHNTLTGEDAGIYFDTLDVNNVLLESNDLYRIYCLGSETNNFTLSSSDSATSIVIRNNIFRGAGEINIRFVDTGGNNFTLNDTHIVGNSFPDTSGSISVLQSGDINDDLRIDHLFVLNNNLFAGSSTLVVGGANVASGSAFFNDSDISGNNVNGAITVAGVRPTRLTFSNNTSSSGTVMFNRGADSSNISDNVMNALTFSQTLDDCVFSNNRISTGPTLFSSTLNRTVVSGNSFAGSVTVSGVSTGITFTNNYVTTTLGLATMTDSKFEGNTVIGNLTTSGSWSDSLFNDNFLDADFTGTSFSNSTFASSSITGDVSFSSGISSSIVTNNEIRGAAGLDATSFSSSTISDNIITVKLETTGTTAACNISGNRAASMEFGSTISDSAFGNNQVLTGGFSATSTISDSTFTGNAFNSTGTESAFDVGNISRSAFSGNVIESSNGAASAVSIGIMTESVFSDSVLNQTAAATVTIGAMSDSKITDCVFDCTTLDIDYMEDSSFINVHCKGNITISRSSIAMSDSRITGCHISGTTTITTTSTSLGAIVDSNITENIFEGDLTINGAEICVDRSTINENNFHASFNILITDDNGNYALRNSIVSDNNVAVSFIMNNTGGSANNANLVNSSSITGNLVQGSATLGAGLNTTSATSAFEDSSFSDNKINVNLTIGPSGRTASTTTYIGSTFSNNVIGVTGGGNFTLRGAMVGCSFDGNSFNNDADLDTVSGGSISGNVFGADGTGTLDLIGGIINNGVFADNFVIGNCTVTGALNTAMITGNAFGAIFDANSTVDKSVFSSNRFAGTIDFASDFSDSVLSSNQIDSTLTFDTSGSGINRSVIDGNAITGAVLFNDTVDGLIMSDNHSSADVDFASTPNNVTVSNNIFTSFLMDSGTAKDNINITGNTVTTFEISGSTITDYVVSGNHASGTFTLSSDGTRGVMVGNMAEGVTVVGNVTSVAMSSNIFGGTFTVGDLVTASLNNNSISGVANVGTLTSSTVSLNSFGSTLTFTGAAVGSIVSENHVSGAALFTTSSGGFALSETTVDGNSFDSTLTITFSGTSGDDFDAALRESVVSDNRVGTTMLIQSTASNSEFAAYLSTISGNTCGGASTDGTPVVGNITLTSVDTGVATIGETVISNNKCSNMSITHGTGTSDSCDESVISGNTLAANFSTGRFVDSVMSDNKVTGTVDFTVTTRALVSGNVITGATTLTTTDDSIVSNNKCEGAFVMGAVTDGVLNSNYMGNTLNMTSLTRGSITGNTCDGAVNTGNIEDVSVGSNAISDSFTAGTVINSSITGNNIDGAFVSTSVSGGAIDSNTLQSTAGFGSITGASVSNNDITGAVTTSTITSARVNGNYFTSTFTTGASDILDSTMNNNIFNGAFTSSRWQDVACVGNTFVSTIVTTEAGTDKGLDRVTFQGNVCSAAVTFTKSTSGGTDNFTHTSITGNVFNADLSLGTSAIAAEFQDIVISGNSGAGGLDIHTGSNTTSELDDVMIVGNVMRGDFNITRDGGAAANYSMPTTSGVGEGNFMLAFNRFDTYTGVTFNNDRAIGWGTNRTLSGADSEYIGSNAL